MGGGLKVGGRHSLAAESIEGGKGLMVGRGKQRLGVVWVWCLGKAGGAAGGGWGGGPHYRSGV